MSHSNSHAMKRRLLADFNAVVHEADQLLTSITDEGGEKAEAFRGRMERNLSIAKARLRDLEDAVMEKTKAGVRATDEYVHQNPWQTVGVAAGIGAACGALICLMFYRR